MHSPTSDQAVTDAPPMRYPSAPIRGIAVASISLGFFSMIVFWWYPLGLILASSGFVCGVGSLLFGIRGGGAEKTWPLSGLPSVPPASR